MLSEAKSRFSGKKTILAMAGILVLGWGVVLEQTSTGTATELQQNTTEQVQLEEYVPNVIIEGKWGTGPGEFGLGGMDIEGGDVIPREIVCDDNENIYVLDNYNNRIQKFDNMGKYLEMYPLEVFVRLTNEEYEKSIKTWNSNESSIMKITANGLAWIKGQLFVHQRLMIDIRTGKYVEKVLVLRSNKFVEATNQERKNYEMKVVLDWNHYAGYEYNANLRKSENTKIYEKLRTKKRAKINKDSNGFEFPIYDGYKVQQVINDDKGNIYINSEDVWRKYNKEEKKVFELKTFKVHKYCGGDASFPSAIYFARHKECFYEMKVFSLDKNNWDRVFLPDGGGMQIVKWCKK